MTEKRFYVRDDRYGINQTLRDTKSSLSIHVSDTCFESDLDELCDMLNKLNDENEEFRHDNDIKFWKQQYKENMRAFQICVSEIARASNNGYVVSDEFQKYYADLRKKNKEIKKKIERLGL